MTVLIAVVGASVAASVDGATACIGAGVSPPVSTTAATAGDAPGDDDPE
jgi:hypothetical protein